MQLSQLLHIQTVTQFLSPNLYCLLPAYLFLGGGALEGRWEQSYKCSSQLTDLLKRFPLEKRWRIEKNGTRPQKAAEQNTAICDGVQVSHSWACTHAHAHARLCLNKHCKLAELRSCLFPISVVGGEKKHNKMYLVLNVIVSYLRERQTCKKLYYTNPQTGAKS